MGTLLLIDKPKGITSFDVIRRLRRKLGVWKMGHAGTLDPMASGLMIIAVGDATKELQYYLKLPKVYQAKILLGVATTTDDLEGKIVAEAKVGAMNEENIHAALESMNGRLQLPLPRYAAAKVGGKRLYAIARKEDQKDKEVKFSPPLREMVVRSAKLLSHHQENERYVIEATFDVGSGTYIRSLAVELGRKLGYPATLQELRRLSIGTMHVRDAEQLDA